MSKVRLRDISIREMTSIDAYQEIENILNTNSVLEQIITINLSYLIQSFLSLFFVLLDLGLTQFFLVSSASGLKRVLKILIHYLVSVHCGPLMVMMSAYPGSFNQFLFFSLTPNMQDSIHCRIVKNIQYMHFYQGSEMILFC